MKKHLAAVETTVATDERTTSGEQALHRDKTIENGSLLQTSHGGGAIVLQWLSYAFWFWFAVSMTWLAGVVINFYITAGQQYNWADALAYPLSAVIIMFIMALITDYFYAKYEPPRKQGIAYIIMLLHVVPFILVAIGALVAVVFSLLTMLLNSNPANTIDGPLQVLWTAVVMVILFGVLAMRAFLGGKNIAIRRTTWAVFGIMALGGIVAAIAGPAAEASRTKQDRLIESALPTLVGDIREYTRKNDSLPKTLANISPQVGSTNASAVQKIIESKLVTYKPNSFSSNDGADYGPNGANLISPGVGQPIDDPYPGVKRFYYQLCTTYVAELKSTYSSYNTDTRPQYTEGGGAVDKSLYTDNDLFEILEHPKGEVCYNLRADGPYTGTVEPDPAAAASDMNPLYKQQNAQ